MTRSIVSVTAAALLSLSLAACMSAGSEPAVPDAPDAALPSAANDTCGATLFKELIGKPIDGPGVPGESRVVRHIAPGTQVTMDYIGQRMNIEADDKGMIQKINCG